MTIALVGIIFIQVLWINNAADKRKEVLEYQVYDALDVVNSRIKEGENLEFIETRFGGLDSLLMNVTSSQQLPFSIKNDSGRHEVMIFEQNSDSDSNEEQEIKIEFRADESLDTLVQQVNRLGKIIEVKVKKELKTISNWQGNIEEKTHEMSRMVEHFAFEKMFSGNIEDRIQKDSLEISIKKALAANGIQSGFTFGVYNKEAESYEKSLVSEKFSDQEDYYEINLFPQDQFNKEKYQLHVQLIDEDAFIWAGIQNMVILSIVLTILLIVCFTYALYFIYKQKKISRIKSDFINNMSHELKTPLASISLASASIQHPDVLSNSNEVKKLAQIIDEERNKMNQHIERVLEMSLAAQGKFVINKSTVSIQELLTESKRNIQIALDQADGEITFDIPKNITFQGDAFHLEHAFTNIMENSIKYCDQNPKIAVQVKVGDRNLSITFVDNGIGMSLKTQKLAFDQFYRATTGNVHDRKGFGLGLSYVKTVVEAHGGTITLKSAVNRGASITIKLPKA